MDRPLVYCVVLSFNGRDLTLDCIRSLLDDHYPNKRIVVVDNNSHDGSAEAIEQAFKEQIDGSQLTLIRSERNLGFAGGNNLGIDRALTENAEFVLLLNNDTRVDPGLITSQVDFMLQNPNAGICGPKIYFFSPPDRIWFAGGVLPMRTGLSRHIGLRETDRGQYDQPRDCDYVSGCALFVRRYVFEKIGMLDTSFRMYGEDADFCLRAGKNGFRIVYVPSGRVWHKISASLGGQLRLKKILFRLSSNWRLYRLHARWWHYPTILLFHLLEIVRIAVLAILGRFR